MSEYVPKREQRKEERQRKRLQVRFGPGDLAHAGYTQDISESGICLQAGILYPPQTVLNLRIEYPEGPASHRGLVRWSREYPPAVKRSVKGGMGVSFLDVPEAAGGGAPRAPEPPAARTRPQVPKGVPPELGDRDLDRLPTRRRQISTLQGHTFEVRETEHRGALYIRIFRLPLTDGSHEAVFREAFWSREEAEAAVKAFLRGE